MNKEELSAVPSIQRRFALECSAVCLASLRVWTRRGGSLSRILSLVGMVFAIVACAPSLQTSRANDPYGNLSASEVYVKKGVQYMESGNYEVALKDLQRAVELDRRNSEAHNAIAVLYQRLDQAREADVHFKKSLSLDSKNFSVRNNYGRFLCSQGKYTEAMEQFQTILDSKFYNLPWVVLTNAGLCAHGVGKTVEAEQYLRRAVESNPNFSPALLEMAKLSFETGQHLSARAFLERYLGVSDSTPESLWLGSEIETALGNIEMAQQYARRLLENFPETKEAVQVKRQLGLH
jgi:type IV pilus assembly protein PilF